jgi:FAD:protein FMN transferase
VELHSGSVSTSGDYERFTEVDGVRYSHILDPRTGWPATASQSATVVAPTGVVADALSTALFVLGAEEGIALATREGVDAIIIDAAGKLHLSPGALSRVRDVSPALLVAP